MDEQYTFNDIAPYEDADVNRVLNKLLQEPDFLKLAMGTNPNLNKQTLVASAKNISTILDFQKYFIGPILQSILAKTSDALTFSGLEKLSKNKSYLFISNHRDILLDSTLLNYILLSNGFNTTQMAIGDNLLIKPWITDFLKLNKSFIVKRSLSRRDFFNFSKKLSLYIKHVLHNKKESIWIAQREGRTKDGLDQTQPGLLKMFVMSESDNYRKFFQSLNIVPISISYEYEPCDKLKAREVLKKSLEPNYVKNPLSDILSMMTGIQCRKGHIHLTIGKPINKELVDFPETLNKNDYISKLALLLDKKIHQNYHLWPNNFIAADILKNTNDFSDKYSPQDKEDFNQYISHQCGNRDTIQSLLFEIYANPVDNQDKYSDEHISEHI